MDTAPNAQKPAKAVDYGFFFKKSESVRFYDHRKYLKQKAMKHDYGLVSYPRSVSTWMRLLLSAYFLLLEGVEVSIPLPVHQDKIIPDIQAGRDRVIYKTPVHPKVIFKSHLQQTHSCVDNIIYIFRNSIDTLVSYYHFHKRMEKTKEIASAMPIDDFCVLKVHELLNHICTYIESKKSVLFISYELMQADTPMALRLVLKYIGVAINEPLIHKAVATTSFKNLQQNELKGPVNGKELFFRKGTVGDGVNEISPDTRDFIMKYTQDIYNEAVSRQFEALKAAFAPRSTHTA